MQKLEAVFLQADRTGIYNVVEDTDWEDGFRRENIDIHRIEVLQLYVLALRTTFCTPNKCFFLPETYQYKNWSNILLQELMEKGLI